jgi:hypothetical protein
MFQTQISARIDFERRFSIVEETHSGGNRFLSKIGASFAKGGLRREPPGG